MTLNEIINKIRARIDELDPPNTENVSVGLVFTNPIGELAEEVLEESIEYLLLNSTSMHLPKASIENSEGGQIILPFDFIRLVSIKCVEWVREVTEVSRDNYKGDNPYLKGGNYKPKCFIIDRGVRYLRHSEGTLEWCYYIPRVSPEQLDDNLIDVLSWIAAYKVLCIVGGDTSKALENVSMLL